MKIPFASLIPWLQEHWIPLLIGVLVFLVVILLVWWIWRKFGESLKARWAEFRRVPEIPPDALIRIWSSFHRLIPLQMRRRIRRYPVYVVLGDDRSGKSTVISNCAFLDVQSYRYHPSSADSEYMKVYLGNESVIIELASSFLHANTTDHANALLKLWRRLPANAHMVMTLNAHELMHGNEENQSWIADALIGKLALFTEFNQRPVPLILVLTHMDRIKGFNSFLNFAIENQMDFYVHLNEAKPVANFSHGLEGYLRYASTALVNTDSSESFVEISDFLTNVSLTLGSLQTLIALGCSRNNISETDLRKVCITSSDHRDKSLGLIENNPFLNERINDSYLDYLSKKHLQIAAGILAFIVLQQGYVFLDERITITRAFRLIEEMPTITAKNYTSIAHPTIRKLYHNTNDFSFPEHETEFTNHHFAFYSAQANFVRNQIARTLRKTYVIPRLELAQSQDRIYSRSIRLLAILHANHHNELGQFFSQEGESTPAVEELLPRAIVSDYIEFNDDPNDRDLIELETKPYGVVDSVNGGIFPESSLELINNLSDISDDPYITQEKLEEVKAAARTILTRAGRLLEYPFLDEERLWLTLHGHISPETLNQWSRFPTESQVNAPGTLQALKLITSTEIAATYTPKNFNHLLKQIQSISEEGKRAIENNKLGIVDVQFSSSNYNFDTNEWLIAVTRSKVNEILKSYYERSGSMPGWIFFDQQEHVTKIALGVSTDESGSLINNAQIDTRLTREAFESNVKPAIESMTAIIDDLPLEAQERQRLVDFFIHNLSAYSGHYANAYWSFFKNISIQIQDPDRLVTYLKELQRPGSAFVQNLVRVKENVLLDLPSGPNYQPLRDRLEDFTFLKKLMAEQAGSYPELNRYIGIIASLYESLVGAEIALPPVHDKEAQSSLGLKSVLSPMGRVSFDILTGADGSPLRLVEGWMHDLSIPESWRGPFVAPILKARDFGRYDVNQIIDRQWKQLWDQEVLPLMTFFPFDHSRGGTAQELSVDAISAVFHPNNGRFWIEVRRIFGTLFEIQDGRWTVRPDVDRAFRIPENMGERLNAASNLTIALWDKDSQPKPMNFKLRAEMVPQTMPMTDANDKPIRPALIYLRTGASSALGFNQKGIWQDITMDWWVKSTANVGIEFESPDEKAKKYASQDLEDARWPLLKLLAQATQSGLAFSWTVSLIEKPTEKLKTTFIFKRDPFELFNAIKNR